MNRSTLKTAVLVLAGVLLLQTAALAGPPLLCHPFGIGDAKSLPFEGPAWSRVDPNYDVKNLLNDTAALLSADTPVIVRMETLRRATLYSRNDARLASDLLEMVKNRAAKLGNGRDRAAVLANFDLGYLAETYRQAAVISRSVQPHDKAYWSFQQADPSVDGYALVTKAIAAGGGPEMEFAAAIIASDKKHEGLDYHEHLQRALSGAKPGTLLAQNIATHFPDAAKSAKL